MFTFSVAQALCSRGSANEMCWKHSRPRKIIQMPPLFMPMLAPHFVSLHGDANNYKSAESVEKDPGVGLLAL